jgi:hypothetical protein
MRPTLIFAVLTVLGACGSEPGAPPVKPGLYPSADEVVAEALARVDGDGDGRLQAEEYLRFARDPRAMELYDLDRDGALSPAELGLAIGDASPDELIDRKRLPDYGPPPGGSTP